MNVLITAYACRPGWGSEPGIGWNWIREISRFSKVSVITRDTNEAYVSDELARRPLDSVRWVYAPTYRWMRDTNRFQYYLWQRNILPLARDLHARERFDIVHHITYGVHWMPSFMPELGIPFVWGPVGGAEKAEPAMIRSLPLHGRLKHAARQIAQGVLESTPQVRRTVAGAAVALGATRHTADRLQLLGVRDVRVFPGVSLPPADYERLSVLPSRTELPRRVISMGRLLHWKGFDLGIEAFARVAPEFPNAEYWIVGDGRERQRLQDLAASVDLQDRVKFLRSRERSQALDDLSKCDVLMHPSMHDSGGWVTLEAMAAGRPVICLDAGGPGVQVGEGNGIKVRPGPRDRVIDDLAAGLRTLFADQELRLRLGAEARKTVYRDFHSATGRRIEGIYREILHNPATPPLEAAIDDPSRLVQ